MPEVVHLNYADNTQKVYFKMDELKSKIKLPASVVRSTTSLGPPTFEKKQVLDAYQAIPMKNTILHFSGSRKSKKSTARVSEAAHESGNENILASDTLSNKSVREVDPYLVAQQNSIYKD